MKYYYTYKITLLKGSLAGNYYFGQHITSDLNDNYAGSGRKVKDYYKKYGKIEGVTYVKQILAFYNNLDELNRAEFDLIADRYENDTRCLNLRAGGKQCGVSEETKLKMSNWHKGKISPNKGKISPNRGKSPSIESRKKMSESHKGKQLSDEHKQKLSESHKGKSANIKGKHRIWNEDHTKFHYE